MNESFYPKLPADAVIIEENDKVLVLVPSKPDWVVANKNFALVLALCNGQNSINNIHNQIRHHKDGAEAIRILNDLYHAGFFDEGINGLQSHCQLYSVHLNMTGQCNLSCAYCYAKERKKSEDENLCVSEYIQIIDDIVLINKDATITFTGGEPLLNNDTFIIAQHCKDNNISTFLLSNATLISSDNIEKIHSLFDSIRISVDGCSDAVHDRLRGHGNFKKTMRSVELLEKSGANFSIAMTVTQWNIHEIQSMADRFGSRLTFQPLYEVGNARGQSLGITGTEYFEALQKAQNVEPYGKLAQRLAQMKNRGCTRCAIGEGEISISETGDVFPCHMLHVPRFCAGNIRKQRFKNIYELSSVLQEIRQLSVNTRSECRHCPVRLLCAGGCWARAFYAHGDLNAPDEFCEYEFLAFKEGLLHS